MFHFSKSVPVRSILLLVSGLLISNLTSGQTLKEKLSGDWVCVGISEANGKPGKGKYSSSREYLRFSFIKNTLRISVTPYDRGIIQSINYNNDKGLIQIIQELPIDLPTDLPEQTYIVTLLDNERLKLSTKDERNQTIEYSFIKQNKFANFSDSFIFDNGILVIKVVDLSNKYITIENNAGKGWLVTTQFT